jgi:hypothetical protein
MIQEIVGFGVLTAITVKNIVFWDVTPCSSIEVYDVSKEPASWLIRRCFQYRNCIASDGRMVDGF